MKSMNKILTLGPQGTFSDAATSKYTDTLGGSWQVVYFPSIGSALKAIGKTCEIGVLPIENFSEGFIPLVLDQLVSAELRIIGEIMLPVHFCLVSMTNELSKINQLFVQFVAKGQCSEFIESLGKIEIVTTESNIESLDLARNTADKSAAIVPLGSFRPNDFPLVVENINDFKKNQTRFLALSNNTRASEQIGGEEYKTSIVVLDDKDRPGLLSEILNSFSKRTINLVLPQSELEYQPC
ncbi:prephenate dehydratase [Syntrophotalea carbinolica]|uniref:prephenate dehydratase n=1 Tax=Syntrophotalea carbinolica TaxID=19 RepID=UPI0006983262|nr:prephenate dehydratase domain-containing protein [Syntrophotalea carbinolica]